MDVYTSMPDPLWFVDMIKGPIATLHAYDSMFV